MDNGNTSTINHQPLTIEIYNVFGEKVYSEKNLNPKPVAIGDEPSLTLTLDLKSGIYFLELNSENGNPVRKKFVIEQ